MTYFSQSRRPSAPHCQHYCLLPAAYCLKKKLLSAAFFVCPGQDSNLHTLASTSPSSWRVYQFHHLGVVFGAQNRTRTCTSLLTLVPETSASTNFAIWASCRIKETACNSDARTLLSFNAAAKITIFFNQVILLTQKRKKIIRDSSFIYL